MNEDMKLAELAQRDQRYPVEAYHFIREAIDFAADTAELELAEPLEPSESGEPTEAVERHFTGDQLCHAIRRYAINQYGYLAKVVLKNWNVDTTSCFGDLIYNMIEIGILRKSKQDQRSDFDDVYRFDDVFETNLDLNASTAIF